MTTPISLSVIVPFFRKLDELRLVLPYNARFLGRPGIELVLVLDEPSQEGEVLSLLADLPLIKARVIVNDRPHEWRPPCKAINVGLRAASGQFILVASPESVFVTDLPRRVMTFLAKRPDDILMGRVTWATMVSARAQAPGPLFDAAIAACGGVQFASDYYGSIAGATERFVAIGGYDESIEGWGGDDDNLRARLAMNGAMLVLDREMKLLHLSEKPEMQRRTSPRTPEEKRRLVNPSNSRANDENWGTDFDRVALDWREDRSQAAPLTGRFPPALAGEKLTFGVTGRGRRSGRTDVVAAFSFRYDADLVPDLIANLDAIVDAWIALDDRASDALFSDEMSRRRTLLRAASDTGARWMLGIDPDERLEDALAERIGEMTRDMAPAAWSFDLRELYAPDRYRTDGPWGSKAQARLFPLRGDLSLKQKALHGPWSSFPPRPSGLNLYHLKMIAPVRRQKRSDLYKFLDPEARFQTIGYDYLADETDAVLETIPAGRGYSPPHQDDGGLWMPDVTASGAAGR